MWACLTLHVHLPSRALLRNPAAAATAQHVVKHEFYPEMSSFCPSNLNECMGCLESKQKRQNSSSKSFIESEFFQSPRGLPGISQFFVAQAGGIMCKGNKNARCMKPCEQVAWIQFTSTFLKLATGCCRCTLPYLLTYQTAR